MKRSVVMSGVSSLCASAVLSALAASSAFAEEGFTREAAISPSADRTAQYSGTQSGARTASNKSGIAFKSGKPTEKTKRAASVQQAPSFSDFYIYNASSDLRLDRDADGYHSEFKIRFDADVVSGDAQVYAKLYLRRAGEEEWFLYRETEDFQINGQSDDDDYYVTTALDDGYPTGEYDVLIDLYESGVDGVVATLGPADSGALSYLPLEESGLDVAADVAGYSIGQITTDLIDDEDNDGYYSAFRIAFDPDADIEGRFAYAHVWIRARGGEWIDEHSTADFWVDTQGGQDGYELDIAWHTGYPTSLYDVQIDLRDSATGLLLAAAGSDRAALAQIPLEDQSRDQRISSPTPGNGGNSSSHEGGGGAFGLAMAIALAMLALMRLRTCRHLR